MSESEAFFRAFHARASGITARAFSRGGSYERLAAHVYGLLAQDTVARPGTSSVSTSTPATDARVLDLACGDGHLLRLLGRRALGLDVATSDVARCEQRAVVGRARELPFTDRAFAAVTCHLAFMLLDDLEGVVGELARVLAPEGRFIALVGGGPVADGDDAFHAFASMLPRGRRFGDPRASSEAGWCELFDTERWTGLSFERWELDLSGTFDEVWQFLASSYQVVEPNDARRQIRERFPGDHVPCRVATYLAQVTRLSAATR